MTTSNPSRPVLMPSGVWLSEGDTTPAAEVWCLRALGDLVQTARGDEARTRFFGLDQFADAFADVADTLDRCRTRLVEEGGDYLDTAWAFLDAGRLTIARMRIKADRQRHARA